MRIALLNDAAQKSCEAESLSIDTADLRQALRKRQMNRKSTANIQFAF